MSGFDIIGSNAGGGMAGGALGAQPGQGLFNSLTSGNPSFGLPRYGDANPGMSMSNGVSYYTGGGEQGMQPQQAQQLLALLQGGAAQPDPNVGTAIGTGLRSLFDGIVGAPSGAAQPAQPQPAQQAQQAQQLLALLQAGGAQQAPNVGTAIGSGLRSLFDGIVGSGS